MKKHDRQDEQVRMLEDDYYDNIYPTFAIIWLAVYNELLKMHMSLS
jgi:hypothetical protein